MPAAGDRRKLRPPAAGMQVTPPRSRRRERLAETVAGVPDARPRSHPERRSLVTRRSCPQLAPDARRRRPSQAPAPGGGNLLKRRAPPGHCAPLACPRNISPLCDVRARPRKLGRGLRPASPPSHRIMVSYVSPLRGRASRQGRSPGEARRGGAARPRGTVAASRLRSSPWGAKAPQFSALPACQPPPATRLGSRPAPSGAFVSPSTFFPVPPFGREACILFFLAVPGLRPGTARRLAKTMVAAATIVFRGGGNHEKHGRRGDHCFTRGQRGDSARRGQGGDSAT